MKQAILKALNGSETDYFFVMRKERKPKVVRARWKIFMHLHLLKYSNDQIAEYFGMTRLNVYHGIKRQLQINTLLNLKLITPFTVSEICKSIPEENIGLKIHALHQHGYNIKLIAACFGLKTGIARRKMNKAVQQRDFENRMKSHVKFR